MELHLRENSVLKSRLGSDGYAFLVRAAGAMTRILPHLETDSWQESSTGTTSVCWGASNRRTIRASIAFDTPHGKRVVSARVRQISAWSGGKNSRRLDGRDLDLCRCVVEHIVEILRPAHAPERRGADLQARVATFDEQVVANYLVGRYHLAFSLSDLFQALRRLSEQTYESRALSFGCLINAGSPRDAARPDSPSKFADDFLGTKRFKALTDGRRSAYLLSAHGRLIRLLDLERSFPRLRAHDRHYYPDSNGAMARCAQRRLGVALTREGDILIFDDGSLRFTYRQGSWHCWNHAHLVDIINRHALASSAGRRNVVRLSRAAYRAVLDVSIRRTGGLVVLLRARKRMRELVRPGDALGDRGREPLEKALDRALPARSIFGISRALFAELTGLDGAVVLGSEGHILAYGAILMHGAVRGAHGLEGGRSEAAMDASRHGVALKVSSDGDIAVFWRGRSVISI